MSITKGNVRKIPGTKNSLHNSQSIISSGIPSLDNVVGGGLPIGSVFLIEEDDQANYSKVMLKYFLAEGIVCSHPILLASVNDSQKIISELPSPTNIESENTQTFSEKNSEDMKIAWRYQKLTPVDSTFEPKLQFGHFFDLTKPIDKDIINSSEKSLWKCDLKQLSNQHSENIAYEDLLKHIKNEINNGGFSKTNSDGNNNILRIAIESLGSPFWQMYSNQCLEDNSADNKALRKFLYSLRALLRSACAVALITIPTHLFVNLDTVYHIRHLVDISVKLDSFAGTEKENNPVLRDYHGLFHLVKIASNNTLVPYVPSTLDLAFKLRRKKFIIEKLHLPPELQDSSEREQDDGPIMGCSSTGNNKLSF